MIDSHCHLNLIDVETLGLTADELVQSAFSKGIARILNVCVDLLHFPDVLSFAERYSNIDATFGLHPTELTDDEPSYETCKQLALHPKVIGIGETGLDFYRDDHQKSVQYPRFERFIQLSNELKKPLIIHTRAARKETIETLKRCNAEQGIFHCFTEDWETAKAGLDLGFYISFSGIITFKNAQELRDVVKKVPMDRILVETDAPWLAPIPFRGKTNLPEYVNFVAEEVAKIKGLDVAEVDHQTTQNFCRLFEIK